ncbi:hypothetical protein ABZ345_44345 [Lentzea sp. NPDC005914]|uniref:COG1470 family protein n=1 Tax=Lentzea sp. NPDC005914 TaxID=3154572 RepID=UPI0033FD77FF
MTVAPAQLTLGPGETGEVEVSIQNASPVVEHLAASVVGLPRDDLYQCEPAVVKLRPKEIGSVRVRITVPERGILIAGLYTLGLLVRSPYQREVSRCEELPLAVRAVPALAMGVQPEVVIGGGTGLYAVTLTNEGNTPMGVTLAGGDPENRVGFEFEPAQATLEPGTATGAQIRVRANAPFTGQEVRRALTLRAHAGDITVERPATFVQRPKVAGGLLRVGSIAAGIAVLAVAAVGGALIIKDGKTDPVVQTQPAPQSGISGESAKSSGPAEPTKPSEAVSSSAGAPSSAPATGATIVDFSRLPDNKPAGDRIIEPDLYAAQGVTLSVVAEKAAPDCKDASAVALRTTGTYGSFLTSARPAGASLCNNLPVRLEFATPMRQINLGAIATNGEYVLTVRLVDGKLEEVRQTPAPNAVTQIPYEAPAASPIKSVTFGPADPTQKTKSFTVIKSIALLPAQG